MEALLWVVAFVVVAILQPLIIVGAVYCFGEVEKFLVKKFKKRGKNLNQ